MTVRRDPTKDRASADAINAHAVQIDALVADVAALISYLTTLKTKLNADAGVADTNYATPSAATALTGADTVV